MTRSHRLPASATATPSTSHVPARVPGGPLLRRRGVLLGSVALATTAAATATDRGALTVHRHRQRRGRVGT